VLLSLLWCSGLSDEVCGVGVTVRPVVGQEGNPDV
jgi:hypothetical protein